MAINYKLLQRVTRECNRIRAISAKNSNEILYGSFVIDDVLFHPALYCSLESGSKILKYDQDKIIPSSVCELAGNDSKGNPFYLGDTIGFIAEVGVGGDGGVCNFRLDYIECASKIKQGEFEYGDKSYSGFYVEDTRTGKRPLHSVIIGTIIAKKI